MHNDPCAAGCYRTTQAAEVDRQLAATEPGDPSRTKLLALSHRFAMSPCTTFCDRHDNDPEKTQCK